MSSPSSTTEPSTRAPGISSFIRFSERRNVDFPQPDDPMIAVISLRCRSIVTLRMALWSP